LPSCRRDKPPAFVCHFANRLLLRNSDRNSDEPLPVVVGTLDRRQQLRQLMRRQRFQLHLQRQRQRFQLVNAS
jgi:hypothetical protein